MAFHFCTHQWEVQDVQDGILVTLTRRDLEPTSMLTLVDDVYELVLESGQRNLHLDFGEIQSVTSVVIGKMIALNAKLREHGGRLSLINLQPAVYDVFSAMRLTELLDLRLKPQVENATTH